MTAYTKTVAETCTVAETFVWSPCAYHWEHDETATTWLRQIVSWPWDSAPTADEQRPASLLGVCRASLTAQGRRLLAKAPTDGTAFELTHFELGDGWNVPWFDSRLKTSCDTTAVTTLLYTGTAAAGQLIVEKANTFSLSVKCAWLSGETAHPMELLVWATITHSTTTSEVGTTVPFAAANLPRVYPTSNQWWVTRVLIPLGSGVGEVVEPDTEWGTSTYGDLRWRI